MSATDQKLGSAPLGKLIFTFSLHSVMALLFYQLFSLTDTILIAKGVGDYAAGAVSATLPLTLVLSAVSTTLGVGGGSIISRALGEKNKELAANTAANVFIAYWFFGIIVTVFGLIFLKPLLKGLGISAELMPYAEDYVRIIIAGSVTATGFSSLIRAEGATKFAMMLWVIPVAINLFLDVLFIFAFKLGVKGAAIATVISQVVSVVMSLWFFFLKKDREYKIRKEHFKLNLKLLRSASGIGVSAFMQQMFSGILIVIANNILNRSGGADAVTAFGFAIKLQAILILLQSGIMQGAQPIIGYNYAAGNTRRLKKTIAICLIAGVVVGILATGIGIFLREPLLKIFTHNDTVLAVGKQMMFWLMIASPMKVFYSLCITFYQSAGYRGRAAVLTLVCSAIIQFSVLLLFGLIKGFDGLLYSFAAVEIIVFIVCIVAVFYRKGIIGRILYEKCYKEQING